MGQPFTYLLARFSEPSSYAGLGALLALCGFNFSDTTLGLVAQFLAAGCGLAALVLRERGVLQALMLPALASAALGACSSQDIPSPSTIHAAAQAILTTTEQAMCEAQSVANLAGAIAAAAGDKTAAADASKASTAAGIGCTWINPPVPTSSTASAS